MDKKKKLELIKIINRVQDEIDKCKAIDKKPGGLSPFGEGKLEMAEEILNMLLNLI